MGLTRARLMPARQSLRFVVGPGAVQHQNGAHVGVMVQQLHIFVAGVGDYLGFFILMMARSCLRRFSMATQTLRRI